MVKYLNGEQEFMNLVDFNELLDCIINNEDYDTVYENTGIDRKNLLSYDEYRKKDEFIKEQLFKISNNTLVDTYEQSKSNDSFFHVAINRTRNLPNKFRIYLSPTDENLYYIIKELLKRSFKENKKIFLKYARQNRLDKIVIYVLNSKDMMEKLELINSIKKDYPSLFSNMKHPSFWIGTSNIDGVYIAPEAHIQRIWGGVFPSFGVLMNHILGQIEEYLYFALKELGNKGDYPLKKYDRNYLLNMFIPICKRVMAMYSAFLYIENNEIKNFYSNEFLGYQMPVNENVKFNRDSKKLEVLKRYDDKFILYEVPVGMPVLNDYENSDYDRYELKNVYNYLSWGLDYVLKNGDAKKIVKTK